MPRLRSSVLHAIDASLRARCAMRHKIMMHVIVETRDDRNATEIAKKLRTLLKTPLVRMAIQGEGVQLAYEDGRPVVYAPQHEP